MARFYIDESQKRIESSQLFEEVMFSLFEDESQKRIESLSECWS